MNLLICFWAQLRDWNEELQSARELPKDTMQQRLLRDRAIFKVCSVNESTGQSYYNIIIISK